jgi:hypothetical protein
VLILKLNLKLSLNLTGALTFQLALLPVGAPVFICCRARAAQRTRQQCAAEQRGGSHQGECHGRWQ